MGFSMCNVCRWAALLTPESLQPSFDIPCLRKLINRVEELAKKKGVSMAHIAMAQIMVNPGVSALIIGTNKLSNLVDILDDNMNKVARCDTHGGDEVPRGTVRRSLATDLPPSSSPESTCRESCTPLSL
ncbi:hypothetical protein C8Q80DRAFT_760861 [Daedaleopsis nitida]|nr:hypothetical protein C8Q80DRAFT_760861 [Daedaleopsis nitida]